MEAGAITPPGKRWFAGTMLLCLLSGCAWLPSQDRSGDLAKDLPAFAGPDEAAMFDRACRPLLTENTHRLLVQLARQNLQVEAGWARVRQALARAGQVRANRYPSITVNLDWSRGKTRPQLGPLTPESALIQEQYQASLAANYEVDVWNRFGQLTDAAQLRARAQWVDALALNVSLAAQLLETWYDLAFQQQQRQLIEEQVEISRQLLELLKLRFRRGQVSALDALQQKQQVESLLAALARNQAQLESSRHQLATLLGEEPGEFDDPPVPADLPDFTGIDESVTVSLSMLAERPDLLSAFYRVRAADAELAAAVRQRLPGLQLNASLFYQSEDVAGLFDNLLWQVAAALTQPLFTGGRIQSEIDLNEALLDEALAGYRQSMLEALRELANAWVAERQEAVRTRHLAEQREIAEDAYQLVRQQYARGAVDFLRVLDALQSMINVQQELLSARRQHLSYRIQFCRALGGHWLPGVVQ